MATMNVSLPEGMKDWVETQAASDRYANASDYVRDLIRRDQIKAEKIARMQALIDEAREQGPGARTVDEIWEEARRRVAQAN